MASQPGRGEVHRPLCRRKLTAVDEAGADKRPRSGLIVTENFSNALYSIIATVYRFCGHGGEEGGGGSGDPGTRTRALVLQMGAAVPSRGRAAGTERGGNRAEPTKTLAPLPELCHGRRAIV